MKMKFLIIGFIFFIFLYVKAQRSPEIVIINPNKTLEQFMDNYSPKFLDSLEIVDKSLKFNISINDSMDIKFYIEMEESLSFEQIINKSKNNYPYRINSKEFNSIKKNRILNVILDYSLSFDFLFKKSDEEYKRRKAIDSTFKGELWEYYKK